MLLEESSELVPPTEFLTEGLRPTMADAYQSISEHLDLEAALKSLKPNDLIPSRPEDAVAGQLGARFLEDVRRRVEQGVYDPDPAYMVAVPKTPVATRPAALVSLDDRVMYAALVAALGPRIESHLLGRDLVLWPRGTPVDKRWQDFERSVLESDLPYVVRGDITGFYEFVDHERLSGQIVAATGRRGVANALGLFLERVMQSRRGLPQGLVASDALATLYLANLDFRMTREGFRYFRHGDDVRISVEDYGAGRRAIEILETELRRLGLTLNSAKTRILRARTYEEEVSSLPRALQKARSAAVDARVRAMASNQDVLSAEMKRAGEEQLEWDFFYHGRIGLTEAIDKLRPLLKPSDVEHAEAVFRDAVEKQPGTPNGLTSTEFHQCLSWSAVRLSAGRSTEGLRHMGDLLASFPDKTATLCSYLLALADAEPRAVARQAEKAILNTYRTEWELAWLVRVLRRHPEHVSVQTRRALKSTLDAPHGRWLAAVEIARLLAARDELDRHTLLRVSNACPAVLAVDLIIAVKRMAGSTPWAKAFVGAARSNRIHAVVSAHPNL